MQEVDKPADWVGELIGTGNTSAAIMAATLRPDQPTLTTDEVDKLVLSWIKQVCQDPSQLNELVRATAIGASQKAIDGAVEACMGWWRQSKQEDYLCTGIEIAKLGASQPLVDALVQACPTLRLKNKAAACGASQPVIDELVRAHIARADRDNSSCRLAEGGVRVAELGASQPVIDELIAACINHDARRDLAESAAALRPDQPKLTTDEVDALARACIDQKQLYQGQKAASELGASRPVIDELVAACINCARRDLAEKAAALRPDQPTLTTDEVDALARACKELIPPVGTGRGWETFWRSDTHNMIGIACCGASQPVIDELVRDCINRAEQDGSINYLSIGRSIAAYGASQPVIDELVAACIEWTNRDDASSRLKCGVNAAKLGASQPVIDNLVEACIDHAQRDLAEKAAELGASQLVIDELVEDCINHGERDLAEKAATLRPDQPTLTRQEDKRLAKAERSSKKH